MILIKEIFGPTLQGEGTEAGMPAIFVRTAGCNMWNGRPESRKDSQCPFCDTDFAGGKKMSAYEIVQEIISLAGSTKMLVVVTGGEPLLQPEKELIDLTVKCNFSGFVTQLETNGTVDKPEVLMCFDRVVCSPKQPRRDCAISWEYVDTLKLLFPHPNHEITPEEFARIPVPNKFLQPIGTTDERLNGKITGETILKLYELGLPWRLSLQTHKLLGLQ